MQDWHPIRALVALLEFTPSLWIVREPIAKFIAGCHVLMPAIEAQRFFFDAARPEPIDEEMHMLVVDWMLGNVLNIDYMLHD
ncbi:hypothetical protein PTKU46_79590 [Paraburkholderia terrae]